MKKILIVDDELLVQVGLKSMINWEDHGLTIVGEAKNGQEAIELFERIDPDIVFVDIVMPVMNGLELIKILKEKKPTIKAVILTSHTDFNYVKEAVSLGVCEYMLKSELTRDNLAKCINTILNQIEAQIPNKSSNIGSNVSNSSNLGEDDLFKIITGFYKSQDEMKDIIKKYNFGFKNNIWFIALALIVVKQIDLERYQKDPNHFQTVIKSLSKQVFTEKDFTVFSTIIEDKIVFLFSIDLTKDIGALKEKIVNLLFLFKNNLRQFLNIDLSVGLSGSAEQFIQLPELYKQAYIAKEYSFFDDNTIISFDESMILGKQSCPKINYETLESLFFKSDMKELEGYLESVFVQLYNCKNKEYIRDVFFELISHAKSFIEPLRNMQNTLNVIENKLNYDVFHELNSFKAVKDYVIDIYKGIIQLKRNQGQVQYSYSIQKSIEYIKKGYMKNITLSDLAKYSDVSKNYLSFLFKQEIGTNFSVFLLNFRINKSKELIINGNMKIYEIADKVGFENPYYFSKVFREITGMTCKEYQKLYYKNNQSTNL